MEIFTIASAFFLKAFLWFSAATLAIQISVAVGAFFAVAAFVGLTYKLATYSKVSEPEPEEISEKTPGTHSAYKAHNQIPQDIKDAYYEHGAVLSEAPEDELGSPPLEAPKGRRFKQRKIHYNKDDGHYYFDEQHKHIYYKASQSEIDQKNGIDYFTGIVAFAEQCKKSKP